MAIGGSGLSNPLYTNVSYGGVEGVSVQGITLVYGPPPPVGSLLLEDGSFLLLEDGGHILLQA